MCTVGAPLTIRPPWLVVSPCRAAGRPLMRTVELPRAIVSGGPTHTQLSPARAAGCPEMSTVGLPALTGPPT